MVNARKNSIKRIAEIGDILFIIFPETKDIKKCGIVVIIKNKAKSCLVYVVKINQENPTISALSHRLDKTCETDNAMKFKCRMFMVLFFNLN